MTVFVKPIAGAAVQYPGTMTTLPEAGAEVPFDGSREGTYWKRRVNDGSVVIVPAAPPAAKAETRESAAPDEPTGTSRPTRRG